MKLKEPRHPVTKQILVGGFDPLDVSTKPFGYRWTEMEESKFSLVFTPWFTDGDPED